MRWISIPLAFGAAFVDFGALALPSGEPFQKRQDGGVTLGIDSSCHDVENYQTANKLPRIQADMYEKLDAHAYLDYWFFNNTDEALTNYVNLFATPFGVGQTFSCQIPDTCPRINCQDLENPDAPGTGPAYAILLSFANFNAYMNDLYNALNLGKEDWNTVQVKLQQTYWPNQPTDSLFIKQFIAGINTLAFIAASSAGLVGAGTAAGVGSAAGLLSGVLTGLTAAITTTDESLANLAKMEGTTQVWYQNVFNAIVWANNNLTITGEFLDNDPPAGLADIIDKGQWVDYTDHPILNSDITTKPRIDVTAIKQAFYRYLLGQMVNFVWKEQGTYIVKYEMSEDDFNNKEWQIGAGDEAFRTYYNGRGYFLQRIWDNGDNPNDNPITKYPPGYNVTSEDLTPCDNACIMRSAADGFDEGGYGFNFSIKADDYYNDQSKSISQLGNVAGASGFFNIPICDLSGSSDVSDVDKLQELLADQDWSQGPTNPISIFCYCRELSDANGKKFKDFIPKNLVDKMVDNCDYNHFLDGGGF